MTPSTDTSTKKIARLTHPNLLRAGHDLAPFDCDEDVLNIWLRKRALAAVADRTANTFVVCRGRIVVGYYSLANGAVAHTDTSAKVRRNMPDPIPSTVLARLAVDVDEQGHGLGQALLQDAMKRTLSAAKHSAARLFIVHALNDRAFEYYEEQGFRPLKGETLSLYLPVATIAASL